VHQQRIASELFKAPRLFVVSPARAQRRGVEGSPSIGSLDRMMEAGAGRFDHLEE